MTDKTQDARALVERLTGFTPGPWAYRPEKYDDWGMVRGADKYPVASASTCRSDDFEKNEHRRNKTDPADANARLIAAAPDLHAALRAALDRAEKAEAERDCLAALHGEDMALCTQLQHDAEDARAAGYAQGVRDAAGWCSDEADRCDDAAKWGGSRQYISDCKAAIFALRNANAKILALLPADTPALGSAAPPWDWAVRKWYAEVANRPMHNVHRRTLDDTWRQVIRHYGGDDLDLIGPTHDDLLEAIAGKQP